MLFASVKRPLRVPMHCTVRKTTLTFCGIGPRHPCAACTGRGRNTVQVPDLTLGAMLTLPHPDPQKVFGLGLLIQL